MLLSFKLTILEREWSSCCCITRCSFSQLERTSYRKLKASYPIYVEHAMLWPTWNFNGRHFSISEIISHHSLKLLRLWRAIITEKLAQSIWRKDVFANAARSMWIYYFKVMGLFGFFTHIREYLRGYSKEISFTIYPFVKATSFRFCYR